MTTVNEQPVYRQICAVCEGRGRLGDSPDKSVNRCESCNGTGKESINQEPADTQEQT
jgi:DnaJ-class molecular chaperone